MKKIDLRGEWRLIRGDTGESIPVHVPGDNVSALLAAGKIPDPYYGKNEELVKWVDAKEWIFERDFQIDEDFTAYGALFLFCDYMDVITEIHINGKNAGSTDNMFRKYRFAVGDKLLTGKNTISIRFLPQGKIAAQRAKALPYALPYTFASKIPHINTIRTNQCKMGWDWGICLPVCGIYSEIYIGTVRDGYIEYITTTQKHKKNGCIVTVDTEIFCPSGPLKGTLEINLGDKTVRKEICLSTGTNLVRAKVNIDNPRLWWPKEYGEQNLYGLTVRAAGDVKTKRIGLKSCELIMEKDKDSKGTSMKFRINGRDIFCKGADWIPADAMPGRITVERYEYLLDSAVSVHMNMLRVWGGGRYETDDFYNLCDEKGILIWHDLMFSCMPYPTNEEFLENVREEIKHQVKRLKDHPCIVLWCGNNEVIESFGWYDESKANPDLYFENYQELNQGILGATVKKYDPGRTFWPGSPSNGPGENRDNPEEQCHGDIHYWGVWHKREPFESYLKVCPRFCTEFGFQSYPSRECLSLFAGESDMKKESPVMAFHQRSPAGNEKICLMLADYFNNTENLAFEDFCWMSQVLQGIGMKIAVEYWRSLRPYCMGTLFWQLNDNWPVISWSSIDFTGRWKVLHYLAAHFFAPLIAVLHQDTYKSQVSSGSQSPDKRGQAVQILLVYDLFTPIQVEVVCEIFNKEGICLWEEKSSVSMEGPGVKEAVRLSQDGKDENYKKEMVFLSISLKAMDNVWANTFFFSPLKSYDLKQVTIDAKVMEENGLPVVTISSPKPAFYVTLDSGETRGIFSDNCFTLLPGRMMKIVFHPAEKMMGKGLKDTLKIKALGF